MLFYQVCSRYPDFGTQLILKALEGNQEIISRLESEYSQEMSECEELGSSDVSAYVWNFSRELALILRMPFKGVVENGRYEIIRKEVVS